MSAFQAAAPKDSPEQSADWQEVAYTGVRAVDEEMSNDGCGELAKRREARHVEFVPEQEKSDEKRGDLKDPGQTEARSWIPETKVEDRQSELPPQCQRASSFSALGKYRRSSFQQSALNISDKVRVSCVRRVLQGRGCEYPR